MQSAPVFKGATRPACVFGVPIKPFVLVCGICLLAGFWLWLPLLLLAPIFVYLMSLLTKEDDQMFGQLAIHWKVNLIGNFNKRFWHGVTSLGPVRYSKGNKQ